MSPVKSPETTGDRYSRTIGAQPDSSPDSDEVLCDDDQPEVSIVPPTSQDNIPLQEDGEPLDLLPKPPDGGWGWMVVLGCVIGHMLMVGLARGFGIIFVVLLEKFETTGAAAAWVHSLYNFIRMAIGILCVKHCTD